MDNTPHNKTEAPEVPSSVDLGIEQYVTPYAETPLHAALEPHHTDEKGEIIVPDNPEAITTSAETEVIPTSTNTHEVAPSNRLGRRAGIILGSIGAGAVLVGGSIVGVNLANQSTNTAPTPDDKENSQPSTPSGEEKPSVVEGEKTFEQLVNETKIEAGLSAEEFAEKFQDRLNTWALAGTSKESFNEWVDAPSKSGYETDLAALQTAQFTNALFIPGYQNEQSLVNSADSLTARNAVWDSYWFRSFDFDNSKGTLEIDTVIEQAKIISEDTKNGVRVIYMAGYDTNNASEADFASEENRQSPMEANGQTWDHTLTLQVIDGFEYISKWED